MLYSPCDVHNTPRVYTASTCARCNNNAKQVLHVVRAICYQFYIFHAIFDISHTRCIHLPAKVPAPSAVLRARVSSRRGAVTVAACSLISSVGAFSAMHTFTDGRSALVLPLRGMHRLVSMLVTLIWLPSALLSRHLHASCTTSSLCMISSPLPLISDATRHPAHHRLFLLSTSLSSSVFLLLACAVHARVPLRRSLSFAAAGAVCLIIAAATHVDQRVHAVAAGLAFALLVEWMRRVNVHPRGLCTGCVRGNQLGMLMFAVAMANGYRNCAALLEYLLLAAFSVFVWTRPGQTGSVTIQLVQGEKENTRT